MMIIIMMMMIIIIDTMFLILPLFPMLADLDNDIQMMIYRFGYRGNILFHLLQVFPSGRRHLFRWTIHNDLGGESEKYATEDALLFLDGNNNSAG